MCRAIVCKACQKPSYAGCGMHIEQVLAHVPVADRCTCRAERAASGKAGFGATLRRLFGLD